jgi:integrase
VFDIGRTFRGHLVPKACPLQFGGGGKTTIASGTKEKGWRPKSHSIYVPQTPFIRALAYTGTRFGELAKTTWGSLDAERKSLVLRGETTKTNRTRVIPLIDRVADDLVALRDLHAMGYGRPPRDEE